jgi:histidine phosphotransferase ChpT
MALTVDLRVAELLCARICHDLIGPVGAVCNGVELLAEEGNEFAAEAAKLIADSANQGAARLEFFRIAFGSAGAESTVPGDRLRDVTNAFILGGKVAAEWLPFPGDFSAGVPRDAAKILLCLLLVGIDCIPRGGLLTVSLDGTRASPGIVVTAAGAGANLPAESVTALDAGADIGTLSARSAPAHLAARLAEGLGIDVAASIPGPDAVTLRAG